MQKKIEFLTQFCGQFELQKKQKNRNFQIG